MGEGQGVGGHTIKQPHYLGQSAESRPEGNSGSASPGPSPANGTTDGQGLSELTTINDRFSSTLARWLRDLVTSVAFFTTQLGLWLELLRILCYCYYNYVT